MTDLSLLNPGTSLQLEGTAGQPEEEAEFHQEEQEKEKELRELLTNAFDDFIEDDILSECSHDGDLNSSRHGKSGDLSQLESTPLQAPTPYGTAKTSTSTPASQNPPAFSTSTTSTANLQQQQQHHHNYYTDSRFPPFIEDSPPDGAVHQWQHQPHSQMPSETVEHYDADEHFGLPNPTASREMGQWEQGNLHHHGYNGLTEQHSQGNAVIGRREEAEGGNEQNNQGAALDPNSPWYHVPRGFYVESYDSLQQQQQQHEHDVYAAQAAGGMEVQQQQQHGYYAETGNAGEDFGLDPNQHGYTPAHTQDQHHGQQNFIYSHEGHELQGYTHGQAHENYINAPSHDTHDHPGYSQGQSYQHQPTSLQYQFQEAETPGDSSYPRGATLDRPTVSVPSKLSDPDYEGSYKVRYGHEKDKGEAVDSSGPFDLQKHGLETGIDQDVPTDQRQLAQLRILYKARGRKLEELTAELDSYKQESSREIRILKHQLSIAQGDREGMETSLRQCQSLLQTSQGEVTELTGKLQTADAQIQALKHSKDELISKLTSAESHIESLNEQVGELGKSDSLDRARAHHQSVVSGLQQKYDKEILTLKEKQDALHELLSDKEGEIKSLRQQLGEVQHQGELAQISRAETINRLTKSLEESQRQCHSLLESSVTEELGKTKALLKQKSAAKTMAEEMCQALQEELVDLREQLSMFESASNLGLFTNSGSSKTSEAHNDSMADLGIKKTLDFKTPESTSRSTLPDVSDDYVDKLKMELERCLMSNKTKRGMVTKLQTELRTAKTELNDLSSRCERAEKSTEEMKVKLKDYEQELSPGEGEKVSVIEKRLRKELENLKMEKDSLLTEIQDLKHRLEEVARSEEKANEINRELNCEISQMIRDYDQDKTEGLEKCHGAYMQMVEDAKSRVREEVTSAAETERRDLVEKYESELVIVRDELRGAWKEVDTAKELYIQLSEEKKGLEAALRQELDAELDTELETVKSRLKLEKEEELETLKKTFECDKVTALTDAREQWLREQEAGLIERIDTQVAQVKSDWLKEQSSSLQDTIDSAVQAAEVDWRTQHELDKEREIESRISQVEERLLSERATVIELEVKLRLEEEQKRWTELLEKDKPGDTDAERQWQEEKMKLCDENSKLQKDIDNAKIAHAQVEDRLKQDIAQLKTDLANLENDHKNLQEEKKTLQETLQKEVAVMQEEMGKLIREKTRIQDATLLEVEKLKLENAQLQEEKQKLTERAKAELEEKVKLVVKEAEEKFRVELEKTVSSDKGRELVSDAELQQKIADEVNQAIEQARKLWQGDEEVNRATAVFEAQESVRAELEARYQQQITVGKEESSRSRVELDKLRAEFSSQREHWSAERDRIIAEKDAERKRSMEEIQTQCEQDIQQFMENHQDTLTSALRTARQQQSAEKQRFETEINRLKSREQQLLGSLRSTPNTSDASENGRVPSEGETTQGSLSTNCDNCEHLEKELRSFKDLENLDELRSEKEQIKQKLTKYNGQVKKLLQDRQKLQVSLQNLQQRRQLEEQHLKLKEKQGLSGDDSNASDQSNPRSNSDDQLETQVKKMEGLLREAEEKRLSDLDEMKASLEAEHSAAMGTVKKKLVEMRKAHAAEMEKLRRKFSEEKQELTGKIEKLKSASRQLTSTPVQTEASEAEKNAILEVRAHYMDAVARIREDVMKHVTETNLRAAEKIKEELARGRNSVVLEVKTTCLQVIRNVLDRSRLGVNSAAITNAIEKQLEATAAQITKGKNVKKAMAEGTSLSDANKPRNMSSKEMGPGSQKMSNKSQVGQQNQTKDIKHVSISNKGHKNRDEKSEKGVSSRTYKGRDKGVVAVNGSAMQNGQRKPTHLYIDDSSKNTDFVSSNSNSSGPDIIHDPDVSNQTANSDTHLAPSGESLNISDSMYMPLVADITRNATHVHLGEDNAKYNSLPSRPEKLYNPVSSGIARREVEGSLPNPNGSELDSRRQDRDSIVKPHRTLSGSPVPRQRIETQCSSAGRQNKDVRTTKETPASQFLDDRTVELSSTGTSDLRSAQTRFKSIGASGAPFDSGLGTLSRERRTGPGQLGRRANTFSAPGVGRTIGESSQHPGRPALFRQSSENSLSSSLLTQYEDDSSGPSTYRSTVEDFAPLDLDTEGTLTSLGLGQRSPRKYNPVPEKPDADVPRRRLPLTAAANREHPWRRSLETFPETRSSYSGPNLSENTHSATSVGASIKSSSSLSNFNSVGRREGSKQGRESSTSDCTDVSYNLRLSNTFDSSIVEPRERLGQSFIPNLDPPRLGSSQSQSRLNEAIRRPVPVMGRRVQEEKPSSSGQHK